MTRRARPDVSSVLRSVSRGLLCYDMALPAPRPERVLVGAITRTERCPGVAGAIVWVACMRSTYAGHTAPARRGQAGTGSNLRPNAPAKGQLRGPSTVF